jgi:hypothetical protein
MTNWRFTKKAGEPWLVRSSTSGSARQILRTRVSMSPEAMPSR